MVVRQPRKLTADDYRAMPEDGRRYELIHGELIEMSPAPNRWHQRFLSRLHARLASHVEKHRLGEAYFAPFDVYLSFEDVLQPDILFVSKANLSRLVYEGARGAPDLVVEALSPSTAKRDLGVKLELYAEHGVFEYWVADVDAATIAVYRLSESAAAPARTLGRGDRLTSALLPGFSVALEELFDRS